MVREITAREITEKVCELCKDAAFDLPEDVIAAMHVAREKEESPTGRVVFDRLLENASIAQAEHLPLCQDTGFAVFIVELGQDVHIVGGGLYDAIDAGVSKAYGDNFLRKSIYAHPLKRDRNTGDNTPAIVHVEIVPGRQMKIRFAPKGGGSENMSGIAMLAPSAGVQGVKDFVVKRVSEAGGNPCPPIIVGVGIGGTFEYVAYLAKKALFRPIRDKNPMPDLAALEDELLALVNKTGIGPAGTGGTQTALAVKVEMHPCHIASLPVAVNIQCNSARHKEAVL